MLDSINKSIFDIFNDFLKKIIYINSRICVRKIIVYYNKQNIRKQYKRQIIKQYE